MLLQLFKSFFEDVMIHNLYEIGIQLLTDIRGSFSCLLKPFKARKLRFYPLFGVTLNWPRVKANSMKLLVKHVDVSFDD